MNISIKYKLSLVLILTVFIILLIHFLFIQWSFGKGFHNYIRDVDFQRLQHLAELVEMEYQKHGDWRFVKRNPRSIGRLIQQTLPGEDRYAEMLDRKRKLDRHPDFPPKNRDFSFDRRVVLLDKDFHVLLKRTRLNQFSEAVPIRYREAVVGYLKVALLPAIKDLQRNHYIKEQRLSFALISLFSILISIILIIYLSGKIVRPVQDLRDSVMQLASGDYQSRIDVKSQDELGKLSRDINFLSKTLEKNEQVRRQWVADISHELRTPVSVLRSNIEAIQDGVRENSEKSMAMMHHEVMQIKGLIDDLYELSLSDVGGLSYRMEDVDLTCILHDVVEGYREHFAEKNIIIQDTIDIDEEMIIHGDSQRLTQMWVNLFENSLKYTDENGTVRLTVVREGGEVRVSLSDSAPGVPKADLMKLFDRFYRIESSRSRETGGAGLGLAIVKNIVEAHGAAIETCESDLGGLCVVVTYQIG